MKMKSSSDKDKMEHLEIGREKRAIKVMEQRQRIRGKLHTSNLFHSFVFFHASYQFLNCVSSSSHAWFCLWLGLKQKKNENFFFSFLILTM